MDSKQLKNIMKLFEESSIDEIELENGDDYIRLVKNKPKYQPAYEVQMPITTKVEQVKTEQVVIKEEKVNVNANIVKAPLVGTYYEAPTPEASAFVKIGDQVKKGQVLCILESMKVMNEITSPYDGEIKDVLVKNQSMVEYDQEMFVIG